MQKNTIPTTGHDSGDYMEKQDQTTMVTAQTALNENIGVSADLAITEAESATPSMDELINMATIENHQTVLIAIAQENNSIIQDIYIGKLAKVLGVNKNTISKQLKELAKAEPTQGSEIPVDRSLKAVFPGLVDLVLNDNGEVSYLMKTDEGLRIADYWQEGDATTFFPPDREQLPFKLGKAENVVRMLGTDQNERLFDDIVIYLKRFSYLTDELWRIIALSVFLTYLQDHPSISYIPVIYFHAVAERGKSRTAKSMLSIAYRGIHLVDLKSANIFRFAENLKATLFFDCTDLWKSAEKSDCKDILLGRYEKGTRLSRVLYPDRGAFQDQVFYEVYGSTIVATNEPANSIFESRCISITMPNMPGAYEDPSPDKGIELKERLMAFRARMMGVSLEPIEPIPGIKGRLWDISKPLFQLCHLVNPEGIDELQKVILEMAGQKFEDKKDSLEGKIIAAIDQLAEKDKEEPWVVPVTHIREKVNDTIANSSYYYSPQKIGKRIQSLSLRKRNLNGYSQVLISSKELELLKEQYGFTSLVETLPLPTTPVEVVVMKDEWGREIEESVDTVSDSHVVNTDELQDVTHVVESSGESVDDIPDIEWA